MEEDAAPLCVPVIVTRAGSDKDPRAPRWFRLALAISQTSVRLRSALPEELAQGPVALRLHLPVDGAAPLDLCGEAREVIVDEGEESERAEPRLLALFGTPQEVRDRIARYVDTWDEITDGVS